MPQSLHSARRPFSTFSLSGCTLGDVVQFQKASLGRPTCYPSKKRRAYISVYGEGQIHVIPATKHGLDLRIRCDGQKGFVTFFVEAMIEVKDPSLREKLTKIEENVKALKEAHNEIDKLEKRWRKLVN